MHVRLLKHWNGYKPQRIFADMPDGQANVLIRRGLAEPHDVTPATRGDRPRKAEGKTPPRAAKSPRKRSK